MTTLQKAIAGRRSQAAVRLLAIGGLAALLAGCYKTPIAAEIDPAYPIDYRDRHPITLKEGEHSIQIFVGRNRGGLTPSQRADVASFARLWRHEANSGIIVDVPHGGPNDRAAANSMREINSVLAATGVPRRAIYVRHYKPSPHSLASITINYTKLVAHAGPCGLWPYDLGPAGGIAYNENLPYWNLGCATQRNLAAMVDNPADLVQPRGETPAYTGRRSVAIDKYRKGESPSGKYDNYEQGKIGEVGK